MKKLKNKIFNIGEVKISMCYNGLPKGLILKRELSVRECRYIMSNLLGIDVVTKDNCYDEEDYKKYNNQLREDVNKWLIGKIEDSTIMEYYAFDYSDKQVGVMNLIPILSYLKDKKVID